MAHPPVFPALLAALALALIPAAARAKAPDLPLIPRPAELALLPGSFPLASARRILLVPDEPPVRAAAAHLASVLAMRITTQPPVPSSAPATSPTTQPPAMRITTLPLVTSSAPAAGDIVIERLPARADLGPEGYTLDIGPDRVTLRAAGAAGLYYGVQTLRQLTLAGGDWLALTLTDRPRFAWRGVMIDVARHFRSAAWIERLLDQMAFYKLNVLHWHLTDDQGWRLPIRRFPRLAEMSDGQGGAYTRDEVARIVSLAAARHIRVIPEIDVPGHVTAALAAYPDLSCRAVALPVPTTWGTFEDVLCPGSESPFVFVSGVAEDVAAQFPDPVLNLGGDEVPRVRWNDCSRCQARVSQEKMRSEDELQSYFLRRATKLLGERGRRPMVWDDDLAHGFPAGTIVQAWHGPQALVRALVAGHDVVASASSHFYLDRSPLATPLSKVLAYDPLPRAVTPDQARRLLGGEAALWSEFIRTDEDADRALFPRLLAVSEVLWSPAAPPDVAAFTARLAPHQARLTAAGIAHGDLGHRVGILTPRQLVGDWRLVRMDVTPYITGPGTYNVALGEDAPVPVEVLSVKLAHNGNGLAALLRETSTRREISERIYDLPLKTVPTGGKWTLELTVRCREPHAAMATVWLERRPKR